MPSPSAWGQANTVNPCYSFLLLLRWRPIIDTAESGSGNPVYDITLVRNLCDSIAVEPDEEKAQYLLDLLNAIIRGVTGYLLLRHPDAGDHQAETLALRLLGLATAHMKLPDHGQDAIASAERALALARRRQSD